MATTVKLVGGGSLTVSTLRRMFRNLAQWRALYEAEGIEEITDSEGNVWLLWDVIYLYEQVPHLPVRQAQAIELCLIQNMLEDDAAEVMGTPGNPVSMYCTGGLKRIINLVDTGSLPRFQQREAS